MMKPIPIREIGTRRLPVSVDRVTCWLLGPVMLDRCRECVHLLRLEGASAGDTATFSVVCSDDHAKPGVEFAW